ncbi:MAG: transcriptional antiterminator NusG [Candidatus Deianiraeaceae bacterium]|jgi:transcriptional antiterminator NusG
MSTQSASDAFWYVLQVRSGAENSVVENIKRISQKRGVPQLFKEFNVPSIEIAKHGTTKVKSKVLCSGYVFTKMIVNEPSMAVINEMSGSGAGNRLIISFLPKASTPKPLTEMEYKEMLDTMMKTSQEKIDEPIFEMGMDIKIISGAFKDFKGTIIGVDKSKMSLEVSVSVFNRETTVDADFKDVEIIK